MFIKMRKLFAEIRYMDSFWILAFDSYAKHSQQTSWLISGRNQITNTTVPNLYGQSEE